MDTEIELIGGKREVYMLVDSDATPCPEVKGLWNYSFCPIALELFFLSWFKGQWVCAIQEYAPQSLSINDAVSEKSI